MKLNAPHINQTMAQLSAEVIPEDHPAISRLNQLFGDHSFFLNSDGLHIVQPSEVTQGKEAEAKVVKLANWEDEQHTTLKPHEPEPTDIIVALGSDTSGDKG